MKTAADSMPSARTVRFPAQLRARVSADAERCGRSFGQQIIAVLRSHYGDDVNLTSSRQTSLALLRASVAGMSRIEQASVASRSRRRR